MSIKLEITGQVPVTLENGETVDVFEITTEHKPYADFGTWGYAFTPEQARLFSVAPELLEMLRMAVWYWRFALDDGAVGETEYDDFASAKNLLANLQDIDPEEHVL